jgi:hypothetical protein
LRGYYPYGKPARKRRFRVPRAGGDLGAYDPGMSTGDVGREVRWFVTTLLCVGTFALGSFVARREHPASLRVCFDDKKECPVVAKLKDLEMCEIVLNGLGKDAEGFRCEE